MILTQTGAMFKDAFRELHARKLFWITMILSALVIVAIAPFGSEPGVGISYAVWTIPGTEDVAMEDSFFLRSVIVSLGVGLWLSWIATIIAIISTAGIVPALVTDGAIDTMLSKPIGRVRLFLTKYCTGLLFVALQVAVFSVGAILMLGFRTGDWEFGFLFAIPIVVVFFSYLYSVSALVGFLSKSGLTALLITGLFWGALIGLNRAEDTFLIGFKHTFAYERDYAQAQIEFQGARIEELQSEIDAAEAAGDEPFPSDVRQLATARASLSEYESQLPEVTERAASLDKWHRRVLLCKVPLPKTSETVALLERFVISDEETERVFDQQAENRREADEDAGLDDEGDTAPVITRPEDVMSPEQRISEEQRSRSLWWIIGTSLGFEAFLLGITCLLFARRDF